MVRHQHGIIGLAGGHLHSHECSRQKETLGVVKFPADLQGTCGGVNFVVNEVNHPVIREIVLISQRNGNRYLGLAGIDHGSFRHEFLKAQHRVFINVGVRVNRIDTDDVG